MTDEPTIDPRIERTRSAVVEAGMELLLQEGPDGINHAAIAAAAGLSRTTLYKYWPTRAKLLLEVLAAFGAHPEMPSSGDVRGDLLLLMTELQTSMSDATHRRIFSSMVAQAQWDDDVSEAQSALRAIPLAGLAKLLRAAADRGQIRAGIDAKAAAGRLIGPLIFGALVVGDDVMSIDIESILDDWLTSVARVERAYDFTRSPTDPR